MEPYLKIEVRFDVPRSVVESTFARFSKDCPAVLPTVVTIIERGQRTCSDWIKRHHVECWYESDGISFAPKDVQFLHELDQQFYGVIQVVGPA